MNDKQREKMLDHMEENTGQRGGTAVGDPMAVGEFVEMMRDIKTAGEDESDGDLDPGETRCIRCDTVIPDGLQRDRDGGLTLTDGQGAVRVCGDCADVVKERNLW